MCFFFCAISATAVFAADIRFVICVEFRCHYDILIWWPLYNVATMRCKYKLVKSEGKV